MWFTQATSESVAWSRGTRIPALEKVGVIAMRRRIRQLVTVGRPDGPELTVVSREIVDGSRREAVPIRTRLTGTGQSGPSETLVLAALAAGVDRAERSNAPTSMTVRPALRSRRADQAARSALAAGRHPTTRPEKTTPVVAAARCSCSRR
jgi:hypothetical protein